MRRSSATLAVAAVLGLVGSLFVASPAHAVEASSRTAYFAQFDDGRVGWYKIALEKDLSNNNVRAKITVWCEPDGALGGAKVLCDAIQYGRSNQAIGRVQVEVWDEGIGWSGTPRVQSTYPQTPIPDGGHVDYSPPLAGVAVTTIWGCTGMGYDEYRSIVESFRAASSNQWSQFYTKVTPTWVGTACI